MIVQITIDVLLSDHSLSRSVDNAIHRYTPTIQVVYTVALGHKHI